MNTIVQNDRFGANVFVLTNCTFLSIFSASGPCWPLSCWHIRISLIPYFQSVSVVYACWTYYLIFIHVFFTTGLKPILSSSFILRQLECVCCLFMHSTNATLLNYNYAIYRGLIRETASLTKDVPRCCRLGKVYCFHFLHVFFLPYKSHVEK